MIDNGQGGRDAQVLRAARRILVLGPCGSGKSVFSGRLSRLLGLPAVHLDAQFWRPGWISTPQPEWRETVKSLISGESWIMDGTYESTLDLRIPAADAIIMLQRPRLACLWGVLRRSVTYRNRPRPDAPPDQPIDMAYLRYIWNYPGKTDTLVNSLIEAHGTDKPLIRIEDRAAGEALLAALERHAASA